MTAGSRLQASFLAETQPRLLKDFLSDDYSSSSSNGFRSLRPKTHCKSSSLKIDVIPSPANLQRSRSSRAASMTISAIHRASEMVINAVKYLPFTSVKPSSILPRSISRRLSKRCPEVDHPRNVAIPELTVTVRVMDILRWKSFRDLAPEEDGHRCYNAVASTDDSPRCSYETEGKKLFSTVGGGYHYHKMMDSRQAEAVAPEGDMADLEEANSSPVSVLDTPFQEVEGSLVAFEKSLALMERRKYMLMQKIQEFEGLAKQEQEQEPISMEDKRIKLVGAEQEEEEEEEARQLLSQVKEANTDYQCSDASSITTDHLLLDFFKTERRSSTDKVVAAKAWMSGEYDEGWFEWDLESKREAYVKDMEREIGWNKFKVEKDEVSLELEVELLRDLVDEVLIDLPLIV